MGIAVTLNLPRIQPLITEQLMRDIGDMTVRMIRTRTESGIDSSGQAFVAYTPAYAEKKAKELGAGTVNLTLSGRMLNDLGITDVKPNTVRLGFRSSGGGTRGKGLTMIQRSRAVGAEDKARAHDQTGAGRSRVKRPFMGLTSQQTEQLRARVARHLDDLVRRQR